MKTSEFIRYPGYWIILLELTSKNDKLGLYLTSQNYEQK